MIALMITKILVKLLLGRKKSMNRSLKLGDRIVVVSIEPYIPVETWVKEDL